MAQFDVYENKNSRTKEDIPYLLDIQNNMLKELSTRAVVPLVLNMKPAKILNPKFEINGLNLTMSTAELAGVSMDNLGTCICSLEDKRDEIISAIDFMITGF
ncbi:MAG: plasmid maintenance protein CcdB [Sulfurimonas sp. RIFOXYD12_FULL_33_39]|uniref:CcdB family protein n=1 Tax=unclassified Sulfurimonas TaxID=2623549 RepID=UPI0008BC556C|nr:MULTISPECIES: CcdB family protein [unclassified Sulfurimonas]OHE09491.1 MAG: plasmid maintenance protein CcdB [Sulfurimonas sp. RIFOXYD12_FULL_33_39]OHE12728.1 MAG: plasmid maintenance protein CcdB [Sulfurimonas sp. RIFOXYD2_FULL_34_21]DAB28584.1 MAG TPA: plasmid maintenance protein CcdB [Sulfurimonas sp. UBA10385]